MEAFDSVSRDSEASRADSSAPIWVRSAVSCWLSRVTWACAWSGHLLLVAEFGVEPGDLRVLVAAAAADAGDLGAELGLVGFGGGEGRRQGADLRLQVGGVGALPICSMLVSSAICELSLVSAESLPLICWPRKNWAIMNSDNRKMMTSSRLDSASTKPGQ